MSENVFIHYCAGRDAYEAGRSRQEVAYSEEFPAAREAWLKGWDQGAFDTAHGLVHVAGELTRGVQRCVVCGEILTDHRHAAVQEGETLDSGWAPGAVTVVKDGCRTHYTAGAAARVPFCRPL